MARCRQPLQSPCALSMRMCQTFGANARWRWAWSSSDDRKSPSPRMCSQHDSRTVAQSSRQRWPCLGHHRAARPGRVEFAHAALPVSSGSPGSYLFARRRFTPPLARHSRSNGATTTAMSVTPGWDARGMATERHQMRRVQHGDRSARVDVAIADLIELCWQVGISTDFSCQDSRPCDSPRPDPWSYIAFSDADDLRAFLDSFDGTPLAKLRYTTRFDSDPASLLMPARAATWEVAVYVKPGPAGTCTLTGRIGFPAHQIPAMETALARRCETAPVAKPAATGDDYPPLAHNVAQHAD